MGTEASGNPLQRSQLPSIGTCPCHQETTGDSSAAYGLCSLQSGSCPLKCSCLLYYHDDRTKCRLTIGVQLVNHISMDTMAERSLDSTAEHKRCVSSGWQAIASATAVYVSHPRPWLCSSLSVCLQLCCRNCFSKAVVHQQLQADPPLSHLSLLSGQTMMSLYGEQTTLHCFACQTVAAQASACNVGLLGHFSGSLHYTFVRHAPYSKPDMQNQVDKGKS